MVATIHDTCLYDLSKERMIKHDVSMGKNRSAIRRYSYMLRKHKNDIIDRFGVSENKIEVIPWGISHNLFHKPDIRKYRSYKEIRYYDAIFSFSFMHKRKKEHQKSFSCFQNFLSN